MVLNDIIKAARFHITESRGIKFELRQGVIETYMNQYPEGLDCPLKSLSKLLLHFKATLHKAYHSIYGLNLNRETFC